MGLGRTRIGGVILGMFDQLARGSEFQDCPVLLRADGYDLGDSSELTLLSGSAPPSRR